MTSIIIDNRNNSSLPPLLLPALIENYSWRNELDKACLQTQHVESEDLRLRWQNSQYGHYTTKYQGNGKPSNPTILPYGVTPPGSDVQSTAVSSNPSLDNLANLAFVAAASDTPTQQLQQNASTTRPQESQSLIQEIHTNKKRKRSVSAANGQLTPPHTSNKKRGGRNTKKNGLQANSAPQKQLVRVQSRSSSPLTKSDPIFTSDPSSEDEEPITTVECKEDDKSLIRNIGANDGAKLIASSKCKRQRTGPSCDSCRAKKIKCDAMVLVICQDPSLLTDYKGTESLHCPLDIRKCDPNIKARIPEEIKKQLSERSDMSLVRHINKLIAFTSCSSCVKKNVQSCRCSFSKGFTRNDIAIFSTLNKKLGKRASLGDFTIQEYLDVGYSLD